MPTLRQIWRSCWDWSYSSERPGPGSGQSGGRNVELEAGSPDPEARHISEVICDTGQATHLRSFSFLTCSTGTKPHLSYLPMGSNNGNKTMLGKPQLPSVPCTLLHLHPACGLNFDTRCTEISCLTERWQPWSSCSRVLGCPPANSTCRATSLGTARGGMPAEGNRGCLPRRDGARTTPCSPPLL